MTKVIWLSDLHFVADGDVLGLNPRKQLQAAIAHINTHHPDAALCVISGDLVNRGRVADYAALARHLAELRMPYLPMVGNHDDRAILRANLPLPNGAMQDFVQYGFATPEARLLMLDTQKPGSDAGEFCAARRAWLESQLHNRPGRPVILFLHHPPLALGLPMQDLDCMGGGEGFLDLISRYPNVRYLCLGHVHRPVSGTVRGIPFATMRSLLYQAPAPRPNWDWDSFAPAQEDPQLGVLHVSNGDVTLHFEEFGG